MVLLLWRELKGVFKKQLYTTMKKSVTLIEVLISAVFLTIIFSGIIFVFSKCIVLNEHNRNLTIATLHTQYVMEDIKNTSFNVISDNINNGDWNWGISEIEAEGLSPLKNEIVVVTADDDGVFGPDLVNITINIAWSDMEERLNEDTELPNVQIQTYLAAP